jgi:hypothetical protein
MDAIFQRLIENDLVELPGLEVNARVPVPERLVNEIIEASLRGNKNIEYCRVSIAGQNRVTAKVKSPVWPWSFDLKLKLFQGVDFSGPPKVRAFLENNLLLGKLGAFLKALPPGILLYEDQVSVDIGAFLQPDQKRYLKFVKAVEISTAVGIITFDVKLQN